MNGTKERYVLDRELIEDVDALRHSIDRPENLQVLTSHQRQRVWELLNFLDQIDPTLPCWQSHEETAEIETDLGWIKLRESANAALRTFGLDAASLSIEQIEEL